MKEIPLKPWSTPMKVALPLLSAVGVWVCVLSAISLLREGRADAPVITRMVGGAFWAVFMLLLRAHPEWQRYLEEKF